MKYFNTLISKIEELEDNSNVINSRILEFWKSTDYEHIDFWLVNKYIEVLTGYIAFLDKEKNNLVREVDKTSKKEYLATKKLVQVRIIELMKQIRVILKKLEKISKIKKKNLSTEQIEESFKSSSQMESIKDLLKQFHKELWVYKKVQELLGITIDLDDKIEKKIEEEQSDEELLNTQRYYVENSRDFLEKILNERNQRFTEISKRKDIVFNSISTVEGFNKLFYKNFKKKYIIWLEVEKSAIAIDYDKFDKFNTDLDLLLDISSFCKNYDKILNTSKKYWLEKFVFTFIDTNNFLQEKILNKKRFNIEQLLLIIENEIWIKKLKFLIFYMDSFSSFLDMYNKISKIDFSYVDSEYNSWFVEFFKKDINWKSITNKFINEHKEFVYKKLSKLNIKLLNIIRNEKFFISLIDDLNNFYEWVTSFNTSIVSYKYPSSSLTALKRFIKKLSSKQVGWFLSIKELTTYYNQTVNKVHKQSKSAYLSRQRNSYSSWSSRSSSNSYSSSSSSSSWSSSSSSGSSSYSSSWSSSW